MEIFFSKWPAQCHNELTDLGYNYILVSLIANLSKELLVKSCNFCLKIASPLNVSMPIYNKKLQNYILWKKNSKIHIKRINTQRCVDFFFFFSVSCMLKKNFFFFGNDKSVPLWVGENEQYSPGSDGNFTSPPPPGSLYYLWRNLDAVGRPSGSALPVCL